MVAGGGESNEDGIPAREARLLRPVDIVIDPRTHSFYIADLLGERVRLVDDKGNIHTVADGKALYPGIDNRPLPCALALDDASGTLYTLATADDGAGFVNDLWKTTPDGVTRIAHLRDVAPSNCAGNNTVVNGIAAAGRGDVWLSYPECGVVRRITTGGTVRAWTVAGAGADTKETTRAFHAALNRPAALATDYAGNLYIVEGDARRIRKVGSDGMITTVVPADPGVADLGRIAVNGNGTLLYANGVRRTGEDEGAFATFGFVLPH